MKLIALCMLFAMSGQSYAQQGESLQNVLDELEAYYASEIERTGIIGSSLMVIQGAEKVFEKHIGFRHLEEKQPTNAETIYHWASITKTFTGIAIMQLRDRGLLTLDDPIIKYLPVLRKVHNEYGDMSEITIRHLMSHTSGFRGPTFPWKSEDWHPHEPTQWSQIVAMLPYTKIHFEPGSKWGYSNPGIVFLGEVIEQLSGDDWEVYIDKNILKPLKMYHSYFDATPYYLLENRAHSYYLRDGKLEAAPFDVDTGITVSNGGLNAPMSDFIKYMHFLFGVNDTDGVYDTVLKRSTLEEMWQPQIKIRESENDGVASYDHMALTYFVEDNFGRRYIGHSGGQNAFVTHFYIDPIRNTGYIIAMNTRAYFSIADNDHVSDFTKEVDANIRDFIFSKVFTLLVEE